MTKRMRMRVERSDLRTWRRESGLMGGSCMKRIISNM